MSVRVGCGESLTVPPYLLVWGPGASPRKVAQHSHYFQPIVDDGDGVTGRSRRWGDLSQEVQVQVVNRLVHESDEQRLSLLDTAFIMSVARLESGFNPDAAAASTSATGIGQFIDKTGSFYGLETENRFHLADNIRAMIKHLKDSAKLASRRFSPSNTSELLTYTYAVYHDGPSLKYGGLELAREKILPWTKKFSEWLRSYSSRSCLFF